MTEEGGVAPPDLVQEGEQVGFFDGVPEERLVRRDVGAEGEGVEGVEERKGFRVGKVGGEEDEGVKGGEGWGWRWGGGGGGGHDAAGTGDVEVDAEVVVAAREFVVFHLAFEVVEVDEGALDHDGFVGGEDEEFGVDFVPDFAGELEEGDGHCRGVGSGLSGEVEVGDVDVKE